MERRFRYALPAYAVLAAAAAMTLEGAVRWAVLLLLGGLALKTWIAVLVARRDQDQRGNVPPED